MYKNEKWPDQQKFDIYALKLEYVLLVFVSVSVQNMVAYVMLPIVIFVLVYSLTISEVAVTFPDTSCFIPHWSALSWTNYVITPILNYPKHVFALYFLNIRFENLINQPINR